MKTYTIIILLLFGSIQIFTQSSLDSTEIKAEVPALNDFHDVIYPVWHVAYPSKDYTSLRSYTDDINTRAQKIYDAQLPGILQDKLEMWAGGVGEFKVAVEEYKKIAAGDDNSMLLKAAENLHSKFETLVRIVHPVVPELDQFHQVLYMIYHKYLPKENYKEIYTNSDELVKRAEVLTKVKLKTKNSDLQKKFSYYSTQLFHSTERLRNYLKSSDYEMVKYGVEDVHRFYQKIEALFD